MYTTRAKAIISYLFVLALVLGLLTAQIGAGWLAQAFELPALIGLALLIIYCTAHAARGELHITKVVATLGFIMLAIVNAVFFAMAVLFLAVLHNHVYNAHVNLLIIHMPRKSARTSAISAAVFLAGVALICLLAWFVYALVGGGVPPGAWRVFATMLLWLVDLALAALAAFTRLFGVHPTHNGEFEPDIFSMGEDVHQYGAEPPVIVRIIALAVAAALLTWLAIRLYRQIRTVSPTDTQKSDEAHDEVSTATGNPRRGWLLRRRTLHPIRRKFYRKVKRYIKKGVPFTRSDTTAKITHRIAPHEDITDLAKQYEKIRYGQQK